MSTTGCDRVPPCAAGAASGCRCRATRGRRVRVVGADAEASISQCVRVFLAYLLARDDVDVRRNPVPHGAGARRPLASGARGVRLIRTPRTLPKVSSPVEVDALLGALRTHRDRAIVVAMPPAGLRRARCSARGCLRARRGAAVVHRRGQRRASADRAGGKPASSRVSGPVHRAGAAADTNAEHGSVVLRGPTRGRAHRRRGGPGARRRSDAVGT